MSDQKRTLKIEYEDISMKTNLISTRFRLELGTLKVNERPFLITSLGFTPNWVYKATNANHSESPGVYTSEKKFDFKYKRKTSKK